jgi:hypothetical protein
MTKSMEWMIEKAHEGFDAAELVLQREVILPNVWDAIIEPGWDVTLKPWPAPESQPEAIPPLDDTILFLDDILNEQKIANGKSKGMSILYLANSQVPTTFSEPIKLPGENSIRFTGGSANKFAKVKTASSAPCSRPRVLPPGARVKVARAG